jgi:fatty-acyl-CoA synthase
MARARVCAEPWVAASYFGGDGADRFTAAGWFKTGDVVTIDADGYGQNHRSREGTSSSRACEWISSVALETALMSPPQPCLEAAVLRRGIRVGPNARVAAIRC